MQNDLKGNENYFELLNGRFELWRGSSYRESAVVTNIQRQHDNTM